MVVLSHGRFTNRPYPKYVVQRFAQKLFYKNLIHRPVSKGNRAV
jgi:hypothetical protein